MERRDLEHLVMDFIRQRHGQSTPVIFRSISRDVFKHAKVIGWKIDPEDLRAEVRDAISRLVKIGYLNRVQQGSVMIPPATDHQIPF